MKNFIAAVNDDYAGRIEEVAEKLRNMGCEIKRVMKITGVITGRVKKSISLNELKIQGIKSVELQKKVRKI
jgi:hypothetical protein